MAGESWPTFTVNDLIERDVVDVGDGYRAKRTELHDAGLPFARAGNINDGFHFKDAELLGWDGVRAAKQKVSRPGDVVFTSKGTVGRFAFVKPDTQHFVYSPQLCFWRSLDPEVLDPRYLFSWMNSREFLHQVAAVKGQTDMAEYVSLRDQRRMRVTLPPVDEQRRIAGILGALDDKIELNRRMSETLEAMARALFKSWFVDFDPVRAKAEGRDPGLPRAVADLFPDSLVDSELGEIPEGWEVGVFGGFVELLRDQVVPMRTPETLFRHHSIPAFDAGRLPSDDAGESIRSQKTRVLPGVVLLSKLNPEIDRVWLVDVQPGEEAVCSTEFLVLRPRAPAGRTFLYCLLRSPLIRQGLESLVTGTSKSHQRAHASAILDLRGVRPDVRTVETFEELAEPWIAQTLACRRESRTLAALRDTLLPKLISGELRVKDAERFVSAAVS